MRWGRGASEQVRRTSLEATAVAARIAGEACGPLYQKPKGELGPDGAYTGCYSRHRVLIVWSLLGRFCGSLQEPCSRRHVWLTCDADHVLLE